MTTTQNPAGANIARLASIEPNVVQRAGIGLTRPQPVSAKAAG